MKDLTDYQKNVLAKFNPEKPVKFRYDVVDCEHWGDVNNDEREVREYIQPLGGWVTDTFWDGEDCGEAYIECEVPYSSLKKCLRMVSFATTLGRRYTIVFRTYKPPRRAFSTEPNSHTTKSIKAPHDAKERQNSRSFSFAIPSKTQKT